MDEKDTLFWLKLVGALLAVSAVINIFLGSYLFEQSTLLTRAGKDLNHVKDERAVLANLLAEVSPTLSVSAVTDIAERSGLAYRFFGEGDDRKILIEGMIFEIVDQKVILDRDAR